MVIKGKHKGEYYDCMLAYDQDKETILVRNHAEYEKFKDKIGYNLRTWGHRWYDDSVMETIVGFAGTFYPCVVDSAKNQVYHDKEPFKQAFNPKTILIYGNSDITIWDYDWTRENWLFDKYGPCFAIWNDRKYANGIVIEIHPCLRRFGFPSILPPHEAYNNLLKWRYNHAENKPIPEMSNDIKIEQAGFDLKTSFRKPKNA